MTIAEQQNETPIGLSLLNAGLGWTVSHQRYGKWFISRDAVIADWKQDHAQAYPDEHEREPTKIDIESWWNEQISWIEISGYGKQIERPDMAAIEAEWLNQMAHDQDNAANA